MPKPSQENSHLLTALVADQAGEIFELDGYAAVGMAGPWLEPLSSEQTCNLPYGSELMYLPDRNPVLLNINTGRLETLKENPYEPGENHFSGRRLQFAGLCDYPDQRLSRNQKVANPAVVFLRGRWVA